MKLTALANASIVTLLTGQAHYVNGQLRGANQATQATTEETPRELQQGSCPIPPPFSPNRFYDGFADCSMTPEAMEMLDVESAAFRYMTAQSDRIRRTNYTSCYGSAVPGGRPYLYNNFAVHGVALIDLIQQLQLLPERCNAFQQPLRELLLSRMSVSLDDLTVESVTSYEIQEPPPLEWWEDHFLPTVAFAFSCGFTRQDERESPSNLPADIRGAFLAGDLTIQRVWRLMKGYLRSPQKQRELLHRQADFDVSLYVPFLKVSLSRTYMGVEGSMGSSMRGGFPAYQGPSIWFLWHTMAARTAALERQCSVSTEKIDKIISTFGTLLTYFGTTHACPYCREHFMSRVSRNDQNWRTFGLQNVLTPSQSESNLYPLEFLFSGGAEDGSLRSKLASIRDGNSFMLYLWKQHNTVTASTYYNVNCRTSEQVDEEMFACVNEGPEYGDNGIAGTQSMGRSWPTAKRYEFWLQGDDLWTDIRSSPELLAAYKTLKDLDNQFGGDLRQNYWTVGTTNTQLSMAAVGQQVVAAVAALDVAMLANDALYTEYNLSTPPQCALAEASLEIFEPLSVPLPLMEDGNYRAPPQACIEEAEKGRRHLQAGPFASGQDGNCGSD